MNTIVKHTVGFIASIVLTLLAVFVTLYTNMTFHAKTTIIFGFAFIQAAVQLLMFMHLTEGKDGQVQSFKVIFAIIITLVTVIGTYWVMQVDILTTYNFNIYLTQEPVMKLVRVSNGILFFIFHIIPDLRLSLI